MVVTLGVLKRYKVKELKGQNIDDIISKESLRLYGFISNNKVFDWIRLVNKEYFNNSFKNAELFDTSLDIYNYYLRNRVVNQTVFYANRLLLRKMFDSYYEIK